MSRPPWDEAGPVGDPGPDLPSMISSDSSSSTPAWGGVLALAIVLLIVIATQLGSASSTGRDAACMSAGGHSYDAGPVVLCLDDEGRVIER